MNSGRSPIEATLLESPDTMRLCKCAKTWAFIHARSHVLHEDIQAVMPSVLGHRLREVVDYDDSSGQALVDKVLNTVDVIS